jgi:hypothetical protein
MFPTYTDWNFKYTPKGYQKRRLRRAVMVGVTVAAVVGIYKARQAGYSTLGDIQSTLQSHLKRGLETVSGHIVAGTSS